MKQGRVIVFLCLWVALPSFADDLPTQCFDFTDLHAPNVKCMAGTDAFARRYQPLERKLSIPTNPYSRIDEINVISEDAYFETDRPKSENRPFKTIGFYQVPPGHDKSVRLGDYSSGSEAVSVEYTFRVDTSEAPLLTIYVAPVLQNSHENGAGMKVYLKDAGGRLVNPSCLSLSLQLEGDSMMGRFPGNPQWKTANNGDVSFFQYLDWPAFGVDLSPYHGQVLTLLVTTYDCAEGAHMGYGYFTTECSKREIEVFTCGDYYELTAPAGFYYKWTTPRAPEIVLSTQQKFIPQRGGTDSIYQCEIYSREDGECGFTLTAKVKPNIPISDEQTIRYDTICTGHSFDLLGESITICHPVDTTIYRAAIHVDCEDSALVEQHLHVVDCAEPCLPISSTTTAEICEGEHYLWEGSNYSVSGIYTRHHVTATGCDSTCVLNLMVHPSYRIVDHTTRIFSWNDPYYNTTPTTNLISWTDPYWTLNLPYDTINQGTTYVWHGHLLDSTGLYIDTLSTAFGCDSIVYLNLYVKPACDNAYSHTYANIKEKEVPSFQWNGIPLNRVPQNPRQDTTLVAPLQKFDLSCDSIATLHLHVLFPCELPTETKPIRWKKEGER